MTNERKSGKLETINLNDLDEVSGGGIVGKAIKGAYNGGKWVASKFGAGVGDGIKASGKVTTVGAVTEGGSRALEGSTGIRTPRPSDIIK